MDHAATFGVKVKELTNRVSILNLADQPAEHVHGTRGAAWLSYWKWKITCGVPQPELFHQLDEHSRISSYKFDRFVDPGSLNGHGTRALRSGRTGESHHDDSRGDHNNRPRTLSEGCEHSRQHRYLDLTLPGYPRRRNENGFMSKSGTLP